MTKASGDTRRKNPNISINHSMISSVITDFQAFISPNNNLRKGKPLTNEEISQTKVLDRAMKNIEYDKLYRNVQLKKLTTIADVNDLQSLIGKIIKDNGYMSTTYDRNNIGKLVPNTDAVIVLSGTKNIKGIDANKYDNASYYKMQKEVIIQRKSKYIINHIDNKEGRIFIYGQFVK